MDKKNGMFEGSSPKITEEVPVSSSSSGLIKDDHSIDPKTLLICQWILYAVMCQLIDVFGMMTNIINIICFVKQGFKDPVNVSLLGLAISDLGCLITSSWTSVCFTPAFIDTDLPFDPGEIQYLTGAMTHITFTRISSWLTALITLERCLCITAPLKVKSLFTPKRTFMIVTTIFVILLFSVAPVYAVSRLDFTFSPHRNKSLIGLVPTTDRESVEKVSFVINNVFVPLFAFLVITVCTITLVITLRSKTKWRNTSIVHSQADTVSSRNQKVAKMVVMISSLFIACFIPVSIMFLAAAFEAELSIYGAHRDTAVLLGGIAFTLESVNSSVNIFIYYHMSSKYRATFRQLFYMDVKFGLTQLRLSKSICNTLTSHD